MLPNEAAFDESYYLDSARQVLNNELILSEHPPLGQSIIAAGIALFGDNINNTSRLFIIQYSGLDPGLLGTINSTFVRFPLSE